MKLDLTKQMPFKSRFKVVGGVVKDPHEYMSPLVCKGFIFRMTEGVSITFADGKEFAVPPRRHDDFSKLTAVLARELRLCANESASFAMLLNECEEFIRFVAAHFRRGTLDLTIENHFGLDFQLAGYRLGETISHQRHGDICRPFAIRERTVPSSKEVVTEIHFKEGARFSFEKANGVCIRAMQDAGLVGLDADAFATLVDDSLELLRDCVKAVGDQPLPKFATAISPELGSPLPLKLGVRRPTTPHAPQ